MSSRSIRKAKRRLKKKVKICLFFFVVILVIGITSIGVIYILDSDSEEKLLQKI